jgi:hypothetical protein
MEGSQTLISELFPESQETVRRCPSLVIGVGAFGHQVLGDVKAKLAALSSDLLKITAFLCVGSEELAETERDLISEYFMPPRSLEPRECVSLVDGEENEIDTRWKAHQAFALHAMELRRRLVDCLNQITSVTVLDELEQRGYWISPRNVDVYIVAALPEPTSGLLLDLVYLTTGLVKERDSNCHTSGFLSISNAPPGSDSPKAQSQAYAALQEIEYHLKRHLENDLEVDYGDLVVPFAGRPFHLCYLLDACCEDGRTIDCQRDVAAAVANFVFSLIGTPVSQVLRPEPGVLDTDLGSYGLSAYSTMGLAAWTFPADAIVSHCALRLAQELVTKGLLGDRPSDISVTKGDAKDIKTRLGYRITDEIPLDSRSTPQWRADLKSGPEGTWLLRLARGYTDWREETYPQVCATLAARSAMRQREIQQAVREAVDRLVLREPLGQSRAWRLLEWLEETLHEERRSPRIPSLGSVVVKLQQAIAALPDLWAVGLRGLAATSVLLLCLLTLGRTMESPDWMPLAALVAAVLGGGGLVYRAWKTATGRVESGCGEYQGALARLASAEIHHWQARLRQELQQSNSRVIEGEREDLQKLKQKLEALKAELAALEPGNLETSSAFEKLVPVELGYDDHYIKRQTSVEDVTRAFLTQDHSLLEGWQHIAIDELAARLARCCRMEFADISETRVLYLLGKVWGRRELARRFEDLWRQVRTLLSTRPILAEQRSLEIVTCLADGAAEAGIELRELRHLSLRPCQESGDKHHVFFVKVKHGFPLTSIETIDRLQDAYRKVPNSEKQSLHAWEEWETLPQIG